MALHAEFSTDSDCTNKRTVSGCESDREKRKNTPSHRSYLKKTPPDEVHDVICVGFGPASLAIAVALHDEIDSGSRALPTRSPKVCFLERQPRFAWHAGMLLPGAKMQITFIKDLATLRNPRSEFTFLNYLHNKDRLVQFTNLGTFLPQRIEYEDYMKWCAGWFEDVVEYDQEVLAVEPSKSLSDGKPDSFKVISRNSVTQEVTHRRAKHVVIAIGGKPNIPKCLPQSHPRVIHSSQYATSIHKIIQPGNKPPRIAVIGAGQSAAEIFHNIPSRFPQSKSFLLIRGAALRPSDDSPFVNEIFDPARVDDVYSQEPKLRAEAIALDRGTNYGVVRPELLEEIYTEMYTQRLQHDSEDQWPHRILNHRTVTGMSDVQMTGGPCMQLRTRDESGRYRKDRRSPEENLYVDLVVVASGYTRNAHEDMLKGLRHLMPGGDEEGKRWAVGRDYRVEFEEGAINPDAGVWLQGCNESTHGVSKPFSCH